MPGAFLFMGKTESESREKLDTVNSLIPTRVELQWHQENPGGVDLSGLDLDAPLPDTRVIDAGARGEKLRRDFTTRWVDATSDSGNLGE